MIASPIDVNHREKYNTKYRLKGEGEISAKLLVRSIWGVMKKFWILNFELKT